MHECVESRLELAKKIAVTAGQLAQKMRKDPATISIREKGHQDFVTAADLAVETLIRSMIQSEFPDDSILGEEEGLSGANGRLWVIDPIDGTTNYMRGLTDWVVSIAYCENTVIKCGVIYVPDTEICGWAAEGAGAYIGQSVAKVSTCKIIDQSMILLGRSSQSSIDSYLQLLGGVLESGMEYRRSGSAALSLLCVAAGNAEAFYEAHLKPWDVAAGLLLVQEAGGFARHTNFNEFLRNGGPVLVTNQCLREEFEKVTNVQR